MGLVAGSICAESKIAMQLTRRMTIQRRVVLPDYRTDDLHKEGAFCAGRRCAEQCLRGGIDFCWTSPKSRRSRTFWHLQWNLISLWKCMSLTYCDEKQNLLDGKFLERSEALIRSLRPLCVIQSQKPPLRSRAQTDSKSRTFQRCLSLLLRICILSGTRLLILFVQKLLMNANHPKTNKKNTQPHSSDVTGSSCVKKNC